MPDLSEPLRTRLGTNRPIKLELGPEAVYPAYDGLSILNLPASLCRWLGAPDLPHPPLDLPELDDLLHGIKQIVVILVDAVSFDRLRKWTDGISPTLNPERDACFLGMLTSVVPSTTSSALTTLWTGRSPAEHGILGYELFLKEYGLVANMITHAPMSFEGSLGSLYRAGFQPESALPVPTLGPNLASSGVDAHAFLHYSISRSGLSRMHYAEVEVHTFGAVPDLWISVCELTETRIGRPRLIWVYYGGVDGLSHRHGPDSEQAQAVFVDFVQAMLENFIGRFSPEAENETLLLLLTDHGQIQTPKNPDFDLHHHPGLINALHILPTGENRLAYLYPKPGGVKEIVEHFDATWPDQFVLIPSEGALSSGLFGPGSPAIETRSRIGDLIAIGQGDAYLWWAAKENPLLGRHGAFSPEEMLVPLMAVRLD
jgi:hypothetical protein